MMTGPIHSTRALPATDTASGAERKAYYLENLQRGLPLAKIRQKQKRACYLADIRAHLSAGKSAASFRDAQPTAHLDDPDTALMYCLFLSEGFLSDHAKHIGVPTAVLALYQYFFDSKQHDEKHDYLATILKEPETAVSFAIDWLRAVEPGSNLTLVPTGFVHALLTDPTIDLSGMISEPELRAALADVIAMHAQALAAQCPSRDAWKNLQRRMLTYSDQAKQTKALTELELLVANVVENAAADCAASVVIGDEIVTAIAAAFVLKHASQEVYSEAEQALSSRLHVLRSHESKDAYRALANTPEGQAYYEKRDMYWKGTIRIRSQIQHKMASLFINLTRRTAATESTT